MVKTRIDKQITYNAAPDPIFTALNEQSQANETKLGQNETNPEQNQQRKSCRW